VPLLQAKPGAIPRDHAECGFTRDLCIQCAAEERLTPSDWAVVRFWTLAQDQVENLTPMGLEGGGAWLAPRIEGWAALCELHGIHLEQRAMLIEQARALHEAIHGRRVNRGVHLMAPEDLAPLEN
jgi:hypothetical protein